MRLVLTNASLIDAVTPGVSALLPGLWDAHVRLEWPRVAPAASPDAVKAALRLGAQRALSADLVKRAEDAVDEHRAWFRRVLAAGLRMAVGSDVRPVREGALLELGLWVKSCATPWQTLQAATKHAAEVAGVGHELGTIEAGKQMVVKGGRLVADHRGR